MAPPAPVFNLSDIQLQYDSQLRDPSNYKCHLMSLTQHECTFKVHPENREIPPEIICLPFKRLFQRCLVQLIVQEEGKKAKTEKWINIEITDADTNRIMSDGRKYGREVRDFLSADEELKKLLESDMKDA
ncbi:uncharacterized protein PRCAT00004039001 [Priceomyces carsonii]|uniref:uncharacterized protein n=1 Tax=Priceomyces carsonii TaxID=28549 RepID=UPI002EDAD25E|nr:unnamed protein product [Priceomyces carsonii]